MIHDLKEMRTELVRAKPLRFRLRPVQSAPGSATPEAQSPAYATISPGFARRFQISAAKSLYRPPVSRLSLWLARVL